MELNVHRDHKAYYGQVIGFGYKVSKHFALSPQKRGGLLGTGTAGGGGGGGGRKCEWLDRVHRPGRPRRPWTAGRTTKVLRQCPLAIA